MDLLVNDCSLHGQFPDFKSFQNGVDRLMAMRSLCHRFGRELYCHRNMVSANVTDGGNMRQAVATFDRNKQQAFMQWLTRYGPFWEDKRKHGPDDFLECDGEIVTETAIGEAAFRGAVGNECHLVSMSPSDWERTPISVLWRKEGLDDREMDVSNHWRSAPLETALRGAATPPASWEDLARTCSFRFLNLTFSEDAFFPLRGHPFVPGAAGRIVERLDILNRFAGAFDDGGARTEEGNELYQEHFTGEKAWFSGSSRSECDSFRQELTFKHPDNAGETLLCPWHGKVKTPQLRIHFSWPVAFGKPVYVVYVGPKITKR